MESPAVPASAPRDRSKARFRPHSTLLGVQSGPFPGCSRSRRELLWNPGSAGIDRRLIVFCRRCAGRSRPAGLDPAERCQDHDHHAHRHSRRRRHRRHLHRHRRAHARRPPRHPQAALDAAQLRGRGHRRGAQPPRRARLSRSMRSKSCCTAAPSRPTRSWKARARRPRCSPPAGSATCWSCGGCGCRTSTSRSTSVRRRSCRGSFRFEIDERTGPRGEALACSRRSARSRRGRTHPGRRYRGGRGLLPALLRQSRPRTAHRRDPARDASRRLCLALGRRAAPEARVRAHVHHRHQRLRRPAGQALRAVHGLPGRGRRHRRPADGDAVERRHPRRRCRRGQSRPHRRVRPRRRGRRRAAFRGPRRLRQPHHPRHGRNHRQGIAHRARSGHLRRRVRGGGRHVVAERAHGRGRLRAQAPGHRHLRGRRRRRLHRVARQGRLAQGGPLQRRCGAGAGVLRHRERRAHGDRRQRGPRLPQSGVARRGERAHPIRARAARRSRPGLRVRSGATWWRPRSACTPSPTRT